MEENLETVRLAKDFLGQGVVGADLAGAEGIVPLVEETENYQRLRTHAVQAKLLGVRFVPLATWGAEDCHLFAFDAR